MKKIATATAALTVFLVLALASAAVAGGNGAVTFTQNDHGVTQSFVDVIPCVTGGGAAAVITTTTNDVFHGTINSTGSWFTGTIEGTLTAAPLDPTLPTYTGHFATWFGDENNLRNGVEHSTFNVHATGTDGSTISFHENAQVTMNANGVFTVAFDKTHC